MTWSLSASGHADDKDAERALINKLRDAVQSDEVKAGHAHLNSQHHGSVNLLENGNTDTAVL
jgi:hypothetical protein